MKRLGVIILLMAFALGISAQENKDSLRGMADSLSNVVSSAYKKGDYYEALDAQQQVVDIYEKTGNTNNQTYVLALNDLADYYSALCNYQKAIEIGLKSLKTEESIFGKNNMDYVNLSSNLALYYFKNANYQKAVELETQALIMNESVSGKNNSDYVSSLHNLATYYSCLGDNHKAVELYEQALQIQESISGKNSLDYASPLTNLAAIYTKLGDYAKAIDLSTQALQIRESILGKNHRDYAVSLNNLADSYLGLNNYTKAMEYCMQALQIQESVLGKNHSDYARSLCCLALCYSGLGNHQKAIELETQALKIEEPVSGEKLQYATVLHNLAQEYSELGNYVKAVELEEQVLRIRLSILGKNHPDCAISFNNFASYCSKFGAYREAIKFEVEALKIEEKAFGTNHPDYLIMLSNLTGYFYDSGHYKEAIELETYTLNLIDSAMGKNNAQYALALGCLATFYSDSCEFKKALNLSVEALQIEKSVFGKNHPRYVSTLGDLSAYLIILGEYVSGVDSLMSYSKIIRNVIRDNFQTMTASERYYFWEKYAGINNNYLPSVDYKIRSEKTEGLCYNSQLLSKGLLLTMGTEMKRLIQESGDTSVITKYEALQQLRSTLRKVYELPISKRSMNTDSLETMAQQIEKELVKGSKQYGDFTRNMLLEWQDVQKELKNEDTAIEFVDFPISKDSTEYAAMVLRKGMECPKMIDLCLEPELLKHQKNGTRMYDGYENKAVYALIWKKLEPYLQEGGNVYFSPSGIIYQMNVEALKDSAGKMANEKYHLYRVSTTKELCYQNVAQKMKTATLYGGLTYDMDSTTMCNESRKYHPDANDYLAYRGCLPDSVSRGAWAELPQTGREVDMIAKELKGVSVKTDVIKGISGTEESFKSLSGKNISIIHLATHGFFLKDEEASGKKFFQNIMQGNTGLRAFTNTSMKRSGLIFAGGQKAWLGGAVPDNVEDGILLAEEIPTIDLRGTDLLVLSACDTGLGEVNSEGVSGLQRGFKQAGVKTIVMSLWQVNDNATSLFMSQFYKNLTDGQTKQEAFMNAQKSLRDSHDFSDPKYWAAFIMLDAI
jgi:CHAT domain-containing protein/Tfp pilus assembly protein PilF